MLTGEATAALMNLGTFVFAVMVAVGIGDQWLTWRGFAIAVAVALVIGVLIGRAVTQPRQPQTPLDVMSRE